MVLVVVVELHVTTTTMASDGLKLASPPLLPDASPEHLPLGLFRQQSSLDTTRRRRRGRQHNNTCSNDDRQQ